MRRCSAVALAVAAAAMAEPSLTVGDGRAAAAQKPLPELEVSDNDRFLAKEDGRPFFWMGDTAWELFHRLDRAEADVYLKNRAKKGFTLVAGVALAELDGLAVPNPDGELPLIERDPSRPNDAYFEHVDYVIDKAESLGMYVALLPVWARRYVSGQLGGPIIFNPENAYDYGRYLGARYRDRSIVWVLGGDIAPVVGGVDYRPVYRAMAKGITEGVTGGEEDYDATFMTYHPGGKSTSATVFHDDPWLDFNMVHPRDVDDDGRLTDQTYAATPVKPAVLGEALYEDQPRSAGDRWPPELLGTYTDDHIARQFGYWSLFAGGFGYTYGNHNIWQFFDPERFAPSRNARTPWQVAIDHPGSFHMQHMRNLAESRPVLERVPDQSILLSDAKSGLAHVRATRAADGSYAFVYLPTPDPVTVDLTKISGSSATAWWYDPRTGSHYRLGRFSTDGQREFTPPPAGPDWVLVLDNTSEHFPPPGRPVRNT